MLGTKAIVVGNAKSGTVIARGTDSEVFGISQQFSTIGFQNTHVSPVAPIE